MLATFVTLSFMRSAIPMLPQSIATKCGRFSLLSLLLFLILFIADILCYHVIV